LRRSRLGLIPLKVMSFLKKSALSIYSGQQPKRFIENIRSIKELESEGIQTLTFTGKFQSELPQLNQSNSLTIKLKGRESK